MWIVGNLTIQITKVLNAEAEKIGDLEKKEGNLLNGPISSALDPFAKNQFQDWHHSLSSLSSPSVGCSIGIPAYPQAGIANVFFYLIPTILFMRMQTKQSEVVTTVLFAANTLAKRKKEQPSEAEVLNEVMEWKQRRRPKLDDKEVAYTIRNLAALRWLKVKPSPDLPIPDEIVAEA